MWKKFNRKKWIYNEIYKYLVFEKTKLNTTKLLCPHRTI
jgi:hypothetical protein